MISKLEFQREHINNIADIPDEYLHDEFKHIINMKGIGL